MSGKKLKIALIQFHRRRFDPDENRRRALETLAGIDGADLALFPEVWMGAVALEPEQIESLIGDLGGAAREMGCTVVTGGLFVRRADCVMDVCHVIGPDGRVVCEQEKIFPSQAIGERGFCTGGGGLKLFECAGMKCAVLVCVDMIYPELARRLALAGAQVILNPANIPEQRNALWHSIARARAAENTVFVAYANNTNTRYADGRAVMGASLIAGPTGDVVAAAGAEVTVLRAELDPWRIGDQRGRWPYLEDVKKIGTLDGPCVDVGVLETDGV